jgi:hypothetical protein
LGSGRQNPKSELFDASARSGPSSKSKSSYRTTDRYLGATASAPLAPKYASGDAMIPRYARGDENNDKISLFFRSTFLGAKCKSTSAQASLGSANIQCQCRLMPLPLAQSPGGVAIWILIAHASDRPGALAGALLTARPEYHHALWRRGLNDSTMDETDPKSPIYTIQ